MTTVRSISPASRSDYAAPAERRAPEALAEAAIERAVVLMFAPLHKRNFGIAVGVLGALAMAALTVATLLIDPEQRPNVGLLANYFRGYTVTPAGALVGAAWGFFTGFVAGWFAAFCRNFVLATWLIYVRARAAFAQTGEFLDHI